MDYWPTLKGERLEAQVGFNQLHCLEGGGTIMPWVRVRSSKSTLPSKHELIIIGSAAVLGIIVIIVIIVFIIFIIFIIF